MNITKIKRLIEGTTEVSPRFLVETDTKFSLTIEAAPSENMIEIYYNSIPSMSYYTDPRISLISSIEKALKIVEDRQEMLIHRASINAQFHNKLKWSYKL